MDSKVTLEELEGLGVKVRNTGFPGAGEAGCLVPGREPQCQSNLGCSQPVCSGLRRPWQGVGGVASLGYKGSTWASSLPAQTLCEMNFQFPCLERGK